MTDEFTYMEVDNDGSKTEKGQGNALEIVKEAEGFIVLGKRDGEGSVCIGGSWNEQELVIASDHVIESIKKALEGLNRAD